MSNYHLGVPLAGTQAYSCDFRKRADTRSAPTWHKAGWFVAQEGIPAIFQAEYQTLYDSCLNLDIDHWILDIDYSSFNSPDINRSSIFFLTASGSVLPFLRESR